MRDRSSAANASPRVKDLPVGSVRLNNTSTVTVTVSTTSPLTCRPLQVSGAGSEGHGPASYRHVVSTFHVSWLLCSCMTTDCTTFRLTQLVRRAERGPPGAIAKCSCTCSYCCVNRSSLFMVMYYHARWFSISIKKKHTEEYCGHKQHVWKQFSYKLPNFTVQHAPQVPHKFEFKYCISWEMKLKTYMQADVIVRPLSLSLITGLK